MTKIRYSLRLGSLVFWFLLGCVSDRTVLETDAPDGGGPDAMVDTDSEATAPLDPPPANPGLVDSAGTTWGRGTPSRGVTRPDKVDLLFVVDNSISMADKQQILRSAVPDLVTQLTSAEDFEPLHDIHVGVISSSLGGLGAETCNDRPEENDRGHLLGVRERARDLGLTDGFLRWTPNSDREIFANGLQQLIAKAGELGCGFESTLEAWYRFLVDPSPYQQVTTGPCPESESVPCAYPTGRDTELLDQRAAFLRPDSLLAIVVVSDEDDCSIVASEQSFNAARREINLPRSTSVCEGDPNHPCCRSCAASVEPAPGCPVEDAACAEGPYFADEDPMNLRCWDQKRRFGVDFLYPVQRYAAALRSAEILNDGEFVKNPLFEGDAGMARDPSMVVFMSLVGVPWQNIQAETDATGEALPEDTLRFKSAREMEDTWPLIVGNPAENVAPSEPLMIQSVSPRAGLAPPTAGYGANAINGHEWAVPAIDDLQYACIFPLAEPRDCNSIEDPNKGCDCKDQPAARHAPEETMSPLCQDPDTGEYTTLQRFAKAYPGTRHLLTAKAAGDNGVVASICARNVTDSSRPDYGYRPALRSLLERFSRQFR